MIFVWVGMPGFREGRVESRAKTGKMSFFQGNKAIVSVFSRRIEAPILHIRDPN